MTTLGILRCVVVAVSDIAKFVCRVRLLVEVA